MKDSYNIGKQRGHDTIGKTSNNVADGIHTEDELMTFMQYLWGIRDAYDDMLSDTMGKLIPIPLPTNDEATRRVLWALTSHVIPVIDGLKSNGNAAQEIKTLYGNIIDTINTILSSEVDTTAAIEIMHEMGDRIELAISMAKKRNTGVKQ